MKVIIGFVNWPRIGFLQIGHGQYEQAVDWLEKPLRRVTVIWFMSTKVPYSIHCVITNDSLACWTGWGADTRPAFAKSLQSPISWFYPIVLNTFLNTHLFQNPVLETKGEFESLLRHQFLWSLSLILTPEKPTPFFQYHLLEVQVVELWCAMSRLPQGLRLWLLRINVICGRQDPTARRR